MGNYFYCGKRVLHLQLAIGNLLLVK